MYKIGEFSLLTKITVKALRFYEKEGLLSPISVDSDTGYRYYDDSLISIAGQIVRLRSIGLSVKDIKAVIDGEDLSAILLTRRSSINNDIQLYKSQLAAIDDMLKENNKMKNSQVLVKNIPEYTAYCKEGVIEDYSKIAEFVLTAGRECMALNPDLKCSKDGYCFIEYLDGEYRENNIKIRYSEVVEKAGNGSESIKFYKTKAVKAVCVKHYGVYSGLRDAYKVAFDYIAANGLKLAAFPRECYIDGCWNKENPEDYLTEIQIPVE